ncbi:MAG: hypothetical protein LBL63_05240, partial [Clostridiales Family XIII bacterium]|nr:hypothetical protein [Clostridiales Family XIII bacterium]
MPNGDALYEEEKQRISEELQKNVTAGDETERRDDYHRYYSVHEGEQFFFSSAYANRGDQYSIRTVARNYVGEKRKPVLNETGSKSERKKRKQDYEKDLKEWEDAKQRQSYYDEASQSIETQIVETRSAGRPESPASEEDRWIGIPLEKRTEEDMARLSGDERAEAMEAEAFYPEMFAEINGARDLIAREHSETEGRDATSKKIYGRLARRLAEASNSYALNEREEIALRKIDPAALRQRMKSAAPDAGTGDAWMKEAIGAKLAVQKRARDILREEIRTIGRLLDIAGGDASAGGLTEEDERYLSLNGIDAGAFREIGVRREGHVSDIQRAKDEAETRRREEEEAQRREVDRLRQEEEDRIRLAKEEEDRKAAEAERIRLAKEEEERKAAEAERLRMLEAKAAEFGEQLDKKFLKYSKSADKRKTNLSRFEPKATHRARHLVKHLSHLNAAITTFRKENEYEGVLIGAFEEKAQSIEKLQGDVNGAIGIAQENYQTKIKADVAALKSAEERTDLLVDAGESEYCNAASKVLFGTMINEAIDGDSVLTAVANDMETTFKEIRAALAEARDKGTDEAKGRKISRQERFEYMKRIDSLFARLESQQAALQSLKIETAEEDADADPVVAEKNSHRATILKNREKAYGTAIMAATADRAALVFTKYERAIGRRTDIGRDLFKTADEIETKRLAEAKLTK